MFCLLLILSSTVRLINAKCESEWKAGSSCPSPCKCSPDVNNANGNDGVIVDCSRRQLSHFPEQLPVSATRLLLAGNRIEVVRTRDLLNCWKLEQIDISKNQLNRLESTSFDFVTKLQQLFLNDNRLTYGTLPENIFDGLENLRVLKIQNNNWMFNSSIQNYDRLFSRLSALEDLSLDVMRGVQVFGSGFSNMTRLRKLTVSGGLYDVLNDTFAVFRQSPVETLTFVTSTNLRSLEPMSFGHFRKLATLDLSFNQGLGIENVTNSWWGLQFTNISELILTRIIPEIVVECKITPEFFMYLDLTNITVLLLDKNNIVRFEPLLHKMLPKLEYFDFSFNRLSNVASFLRDVWMLKRLKYLDVSHQAKRYLSPDESDDFHRSPAKGLLGVRNTDLDNAIAVDDWTSDCHTEQLRACTKSPSISVGRDFPLPDHGPWCFFLPPHVEIVNLTASLNVELYRMPTIIAFGGEHLRKLEYRQNGIRKMSGHIIVTMPNSKLSLDFSDNGITCFSPDVFNISRIFGCFISELDLSGNSLAGQLQSDTSGKTFKDLNKLKTLNLARNGIVSLNNRTFGQLEILEKLNLSQNYLKTIDFEFSHMHVLSQLDVSYNMLSSLGLDITRKLSTLFESHNVSDLVVDFVGNPIQCSCDTLKFLHWMHGNRKRFLNFDSYSCNLRDSVVFFANISSTILRELDFACSKPLAVVIAGSLLGLLSVLVTSSVFCYRYRWEIRYLCLKLSKRGHDYHVLVSRTVYDYDAFVVYDSADRNWVNDELLPHIEGDAVPDAATANTCTKHRLCVHERDFLLGEDIIGNIWNKMESSRKTICVISRSFAKSHFCNYEVQLARMNSVEQARNLIIPILLEHVDLRDMSEVLSWVVRRLTYIEWPAHAQADREEFWERLREAIGSP